LDFSKPNVNEEFIPSFNKNEHGIVELIPWKSNIFFVICHERLVFVFYNKFYKLIKTTMIPEEKSMDKKRIPVRVGP